MTTFAIFNGEIYTPDTIIPDGLILIEGDVIRAVGRSETIPVPPDACLIDARGGCITPGLIDLEQHQLPPGEGVTSYLRNVQQHDLHQVEANGDDVKRSGARLLGYYVRSMTGGDWRQNWALSRGMMRLLEMENPPDLSNGDLDLWTGSRIIPVIDLQSSLESWAAAARSGRPVCVKVPPPDSSANELWWLAASDSLNKIAPATIRASLQRQRLILSGSEGLGLSYRSVRRLMAQAEVDFATALSAATTAPATLLGLETGRLAPGSSADILCWTPHGKLAWRLLGGEVVLPSPAVKESPPARSYVPDIHDHPVIEFLRRHQATRTLTLLPQHEYTNAHGLSLRWMFQDGRGDKRSTMICLHTDARPVTTHLLFESGNSDPLTPFLLTSQASWLFYYFAASSHLTCFPLRSLRQWFDQHQYRYRLPHGNAPGLPENGALWLIPFRKLVNHLPSVRSIKLSCSSFSKP